MDAILETSFRISLSEPISVLSVSGNPEGLLGFKQEELLSGHVSLASRIHDHDHDIADELFSSSNNKLSGIINLRIRQANGRIRCTKGIYTKTDSANNGSMILELLLQDAKGLTQALGEQHLVTNFKAMMENTNDYIYFKDRNHVFTGASQTLVELTEPSEHWTDLLGQTDYDVFPEEYADIYYELEKQVFSGVSVAHGEQEILDNEGKEGWVDNRKYPIHDSNGGIIGLFGIARDVTDKYNKQQKIEQLVAEQTAILDNQLVSIVTLRGRHVLWANSAFETALGYDKNELIGVSTRQFYVTEADYQSVGEDYANIDKDGVVRDELEFIRKDGQHVWVDVRGAALHAGSADSIWIIVDVTERKNTRDRLQLSQLYGGIGTWEYDFITKLSICSDVVLKELGFPLTADRSSWDDVFEAICLEDREHVNEAIKLHIEEGVVLDVEYRIIDTDEQIRWMRTIGKAEFDTDNNPIKMRGTVQEITAQKIAEDSLRIAAVAFDTQEGMLVTDANRIILNANKAFTQISGYSSEELIGKNSRIFRTKQGDASFYDVMWEEVNRTGHWEGEVISRHKKGHTYIERLTVTAVKDDKGVITNYVGTHTDITERKAAEEKIEIFAFYDSLTQLPNRRLLIDRVQQSLYGSTRSKNEGALLFLDLDNFKLLNDSFGHDVGDMLLQQVSQRLIACVREDDTVARIGGDEFIILLENLDKNHREATAQAGSVAKKILFALNQPYQLGEHEYIGSTSIGITLFQGSQTGVENLIKHADTAMYQAKRDGRNSLRFFELQMH
ncbi:MAG: PAS domain S-box protein [Methylophagaceae bacterium]